MSTNEPAQELAAGYLGLADAVPGLPSAWYFDGAHHERELKQIWGRNWLYVCRSSELAAPRAFRTYDLGSQPVVARKLGPAVEFTSLVMNEDAAACELNQRGLQSAAHSRGVLMPEEYLIAQFQQWVRNELAR